MNEETIEDTNPQNEKPEPEPYPEECAVSANCERGRPDDWFEVHYGGTGETFHFCARHALPAEALITLGGWRARDVPDGLRLLERGGARALAGNDGAAAERAKLPPLVHTGTLVKCGQDNCPLLAVYGYHWPGKGAELFVCLTHGRTVEHVARAMGFAVELRPLPGAVDDLVENGG